MGNKKMIIFAILLGLLTAGGIYGYLEYMKRSIDNTQYMPVVVAKRDVAAKTQIAADMVEIKKVPQSYRHPNAAGKVEDVVGTVTLEPLVAGEQVLSQRLVRDREAKGGLAFLVPKDKRAVTVAVNDVKGVGGNLRAGDHVDVMTTFDLDDPKPTRSFSVVAIQDVVVLAVGKMDNEPVSGEKTDKKAVENKTVTLAVSPQQAQPLILASERGAVQLMLRNPVDDSRVESWPLEIHEMISPERVPPTGTP